MKRIISSLCVVSLLAANLFFIPNIVHALPTGFVRTTVVDSGLRAPTNFAFAPDGRIFVIERTGKVKIVKNGAVLPQAFVELPAATNGDKGLIGVAVDPNFVSNHFLYLYYTREDGDNDLNFIVRYNATNNSTTDTPTILFQTLIPSANFHVGGGLKFGPDGKLYFAVGDNAYSQNAQDLLSPFGKIHRINKDGSIPSDNPFNTDGTRSDVNPTAARSSIWAYGLRNPWRIDFDNETGILIASDVGSTRFEEYNLIERGKNYGWPLHEGTCQSSCTNFVNPFFMYEHEAGAAITGGPIYRGSMFPSEYRGTIFFGDYVNGFLKNLKTEIHSHSPGTHEIHIEGQEEMIAPGQAGVVVAMDVAPDGSLYYLSYLNADYSPGGVLYRISYTEDNHLPHVVATTDVTSGTAPLTVNFSSIGSTDEDDDDDLVYSWNFGDSTTSTEPNPVKIYTNQGVYHARLTVSDDEGSSHSALITIKVGTPPTVTISAPTNNTKFRANDTINFAATAVDSLGANMPDSAFEFEALLHHNTHSHPFLGPDAGKRTGSFVIPNTGETDPDIWYEIIMSATDANGLKSSTSVAIQPELSKITLASDPAGINLILDGTPWTTPITKQGVENVVREISAPQIVQKNGRTYEFSHWSDGGARTHTIATPLNDTTYTAVFNQIDINVLQNSGFGEGLTGWQSDPQATVVDGAITIESGNFSQQTTADLLQNEFMHLRYQAGNPGNTAASFETVLSGTQTSNGQQVVSKCTHSLPAFANLAEFEQFFPAANQLENIKLTITKLTGTKLKFDNFNAEPRGDLAISASKCVNALIPLDVNIVQNYNFTQGMTNWGTWGDVQATVVNEALNITRNGPRDALYNQSLYYRADMDTSLNISLVAENKSNVAKSFSVNMRSEETWAGTISCNFSIPANSPKKRYVLFGKPLAPLGALKIQVHVNPNDNVAGLVFDDFEVKRPSRTDYSGINCREWGIEERTDQFPDVPMSHVFAKNIYALKDDGVIDGYQNGYFGPSDSVNRGQLAKFVRKGLDMQYNTTCQPFADVPAIHSFYKDIMTLKCIGAITGDANNKIYPSKLQTREVLMEWVIKAARIKKRGFDDPTFLKNKYTTQVFTDVPTSSQFYQPIMSAYSNNIAHGYSNGTGKFGVGDNVTRGALAKIIDNVRVK